jgi:putative endopeptidase
LQDRNLRIVKDILETSSAKKTRTAIEQKIGDYYASCTDENGIEARGIRPLKPDFDHIDGLKDKKQLAVEIVKLRSAGIGGFLRQPMVRGEKACRVW